MLAEQSGELRRLEASIDKSNFKAKARQPLQEHIMICSHALMETYLGHFCQIRLKSGETIQMSTYM